MFLELDFKVGYMIDMFKKKIKQKQIKTLLQSFEIVKGLFFRQFALIFCLLIYSSDHS